VALTLATKTNGLGFENAGLETSDVIKDFLLKTNAKDKDLGPKSRPKEIKAKTKDKKTSKSTITSITGVGKVKS